MVDAGKFGHVVEMEGGLSMSTRSDVGLREWLIVQCRSVKDEVVFDGEVFLDDVRGG